jgi:hypothetical protein
MSAIETTPVGASFDLNSMELCHIGPATSDLSYCGAPWGSPGECGWYRGEAICPSCGNPTCPRCAQLSALEDAIQ